MELPRFEPRQLLDFAGEWRSGHTPWVARTSGCALLIYVLLVGTLAYHEKSVAALLSMFPFVLLAFWMIGAGSSIAGSILVKNRKNRGAIELVAEKDVHGIFIRDSEGRRQLFLGTWEDNPGLRLKSVDGSEVFITAARHGALLSIADKKRNEIRMEVNDESDTKMMMVRHEKPTPSVVLAAAQDMGPTLVLQGESEAAVLNGGDAYLELRQKTTTKRITARKQ